MQEAFDPITIIFLVLAVFVILRLRSVLGQRTGEERPPFDPFQRRETAAKPAPKETGKVIPLPGAANDKGARPQAVPATDDPERWKGIAAAEGPVASGLDEIARAFGGFDANGFLQGGRAAYEMIVNAFAAGDRKTLKDLLGREVFDGFVAAIADREKRGEKVENTFVSIDKAEIEEAEMKGSQAQITVRFVSKLITATRDREGRVIDGDPNAVVDVTDVWTFARDVRARGPEWLLIATEAGQ
jgi:predicted lipid-binding transport protein (Tim44 family)